MIFETDGKTVIGRLFIFEKASSCLKRETISPAFSSSGKALLDVCALKKLNNHTKYVGIFLKDSCWYSTTGDTLVKWPSPYTKHFWRFKFKQTHLTDGTTSFFVDPPYHKHH